MKTKIIGIIVASTLISVSFSFVLIPSKDDDKDVKVEQVNVASPAGGFAFEEKI
jgi:hypothetical protein